MKHLMVLGLTASVVALASCSSDELIQAPSSAGATPIALRSGAVNKSTRAAEDLTSDNIADFKVTGWIVTKLPDGNNNGASATVSLKDVFSEEDVKKSGTDWTYSNTQYWVKDSIYYFNAYAPASAAVEDFTDGVVPDYYEGTDNSKSLYLGGTFKFTNKPKDAYTKPSADQARRRSSEGGEGTEASSTSTTEYYQPVTDLLYAQKTEVTGASDAVVDFTFNHALARVKFKFTNTFTNSKYSFDVEDIVLHNAMATGECTIGESAAITWAEPTTQESGNGAPRKTNEVTNQDNTSTNTNVFDIYFGGIDELTVASTADSAPRKGLSRDDSSSSDTGDSDHYYLIPVDGASYTVTFVVNEYIDGEPLATYEHKDVTLPTVDMAAGNSYVYSLEIDGSNIDPDGSTPIKFSVTVADWADFGDDNAVSGYPASE